MNRGVAIALLLMASVREFVWQWVVPDLQGDVREITLWPLIVLLCVLVAINYRDRLICASCAAVALMSSTSAGCSLAYLIQPWAVEPGQEQCTAHWGAPMLLVSGLAAVLVLALWKDSNDG